MAFAAAVNAYSFSLTAAIPLIQSDAWYFLDGFLGRFLEYGFVAGDLFRQANPADTNLPLQKAFLFFHTRYFGMDFRLEGLLATAAAIGTVAFFVQMATRDLSRRWRAEEWLLLAMLALAYLSLNSTNIYTWPLAGMWFIQILVGLAYIAYVAPSGRSTPGLVAAACLIGVLLDEVAYPVVMATLGAALATYSARPRRELGRIAAAALAGLALSRMLYWWFNRDVQVQADSARTFAPFLSPDVWKAASIPLAESLVTFHNLPELFGAAAGLVANVVALSLAVAHLAFWWAIVRSQPYRFPNERRLTFVAAGTMLLCYGLVAGIVLQRVPAFGFDYLHQPRYVLFYQLNIAALLLIAYRHAARREATTSIVAAVAPLSLVLFAALQWQLSTLAWKHVKYLSLYTQGVARSIGRLQLEPGLTMQCADIMTVCEFAPAKRAELLDRLLRYRMNVFSPDFQSFYRLHPYGAPDAAPAAEQAPAR